MNSRLFKPLLILSSLFLAPVLSYAACACGADCKCAEPCACSAEETVAPPVQAGHPLKGVVQSVMADRQALLVKHEEIPGVMRAMTMMLQVAPAVLTQVKAGDAITAQLHRGEDGVWSLTDVKVIPADT